MHGQIVDKDIGTAAQARTLIESNAATFPSVFPMGNGAAAQMRLDWRTSTVNLSATYILRLLDSSTTVECRRRFFMYLYLDTRICVSTNDCI